jgi:DNA modification methylase
MTLALIDDIVDHDQVASPKPYRYVIAGDARRLPLRTDSVDLIVTSPPYWRKRDYGSHLQIGQERTPEEFVLTIIACLKEWRRVLRPSGSVFLNIGDTYWRKSLQGIPSLIEAGARADKWVIRNRIVWVKKGGMPDPAQDRLAGRHEYVLHLAVNGYYYDLHGYAKEYSQHKRGANPGDVWEIRPRLNLGKHLAPFPPEIAERAIRLACPRMVCSRCGSPRIPQYERTFELDEHRPQARRAKQLALEHGLTPAHIAAIQATGISDAGKARLVQSGTDKNAEHVRELAAEAKAVLGGYFREFTFAKRKFTRWIDCACGEEFKPGIVLDPFMGSGTTLDVAAQLGRSAIGVDIDVSQVQGRESC